MTATRTESDSFGPLNVPANKYWGAQTQRSLMNFPIGWEKQPVAIIRALGVIKHACAQANKASGKLDAKLADAIITGRQHRCNMELALHVVDILTSIERSAETHQWIEMSTTCERPDALTPEQAQTMLNTDVERPSM